MAASFRRIAAAWAADAATSEESPLALTRPTATVGCAPKFAGGTDSSSAAVAAGDAKDRDVDDDDDDDDDADGDPGGDPDGNADDDAEAPASRALAVGGGGRTAAGR